MTEADGFYLDRRSQRELVGILGRIPELVEDLSVTLTRQGRISRGDMGKPRRRNLWHPRLAAAVLGSTGLSSGPGALPHN